MIQSALSADPILERLTKAIVARVHPRRIVLFGSRARGDARPESDYDVMIEEEQEFEDAWTRAHEIAHAVRRHLDVAVQVTLRTPAEFERRKDDVGTIDYDIAREGIVLYADPAISGVADLSPAKRVREKPGTPPESVAEWIEAADKDLWVIERLVAPGAVRWEPVAFHCQQAAEKYLKAALVNRHVKPPRTHDLGALLLQLNDAGYLTQALESECEHLTDYAIDARYPKLHVNEAAGRRAVADGQRVVDQVKRWLSQE